MSKHNKLLILQKGRRALMVFSLLIYNIFHLVLLRCIKKMIDTSLFKYGWNDICFHYMQILMHVNIQMEIKYIMNLKMLILDWELCIKTHHKLVIMQFSPLHFAVLLQFRDYLNNIYLVKWLSRFHTALALSPTL